MKRMTRATSTALIIACIVGICATIWLRMFLTAPPADASTLVLPTPTTIYIVQPEPTTTTTAQPTPVEDTSDPIAVPVAADIADRCITALTSVVFTGLEDPAFCVPTATANYAYYYPNTKSIQLEMKDLTQEVFNYTLSHERMHEWDFEHLLQSDRDQIVANFGWPDWNVEVWAETANRCERPEDNDGFNDGHPGWFFGQYNDLLVTYTDTYGGSPTDDMCSWLFAAGMLPERIS